MTREEFLTKYAVDRRGTDSVKWDKVGKIYGNPDATPMFIADMDFSIPETVQQAIKAGVGAEIDVVLGGHTDPSMGGPVKAKAIVKASDVLVAID